MNSKKKLLIVRHAKSDWHYDDLNDIDRPLKPRGVNDAYTMANRLKEKNIFPDMIYSSPATRALHTAVIFGRILELPLNKITIQKEIYMAYVREVTELLTSIDPNINTLMIFGHNPTFTSLANFFLEDFIDHLPTTGIVSLNFETDSWKNISKNNAKMLFFDYPKKI